MSSAYRTHTCGQLRPEHVGQQARLSGWVQRKRDHGNLLFIDLRDHYGVTQVVVDVSSPVFKTAEAVRNESVITVSGKVVAREASTVNAKLATGAVELDAAEMVVQSMADPLPIPVYQENDTTPEELRLKYRFLDLRKDKLHKNIMLRSQVISSLRRRMIDQGFMEFQTPILTADSPEGARSSKTRNGGTGPPSTAYAPSNEPTSASSGENQLERGTSSSALMSAAEWAISVPKIPPTCRATRTGLKKRPTGRATVSSNCFGASGPLFSAGQSR